VRAPLQRVATDPCSCSSSPLDSTLFVAIGVQSRKHVFASVGEGGGDAVMDCHGLSRGMALADWRGLGRRPWRPQCAGEDLGGRSPSPTSPRQSTMPPLFLPAPEHDAASFLKVSQHNAASPRRPPPPCLLPHHVHTRLEAAPPPPSLAGWIPARYQMLR
jgi:hypothetical protein